MKLKPNPVGSWTEYFASTLNKPLHPLYGEVAFTVGASALELGAGVGTGTKFLLDSGLRVTAVDLSPDAVHILRERCPEATVLEMPIEECSFPLESFDYVIAGFCLFFLQRDACANLLSQIQTWLKPGGLFIGQFLGADDDWAPLGYLTHSESEILQSFPSFELLYWEEVNREGFVSQGMSKHWHIFHVILRK